MVVKSSEDCGGVSRKHVFGIAAVMLAMLVFGGSLIESLLLAGIGSAPFGYGNRLPGLCRGWRVRAQQRGAYPCVTMCSDFCASARELTVPLPVAWMAPQYMYVACPVACKQCVPPADTVVAPAPTPIASQVTAPQVTAACVDSDAQQCPLWKANGDCTSNSEWMQSNCCKSCSATRAHRRQRHQQHRRLRQLWQLRRASKSRVDSDAQQCPCGRPPTARQQGVMQPNCCKSCFATESTPTAAAPAAPAARQLWQLRRAKSRV